MAKESKKKRRSRVKDEILKAFVKGKITASQYFRSKGLTTHHAYARKAFTILPNRMGSAFR